MTAPALQEALVSVWQQMLAEEREEVTLDGPPVRVGRTRNQGLRVAGFPFQGRRIEAIEQNPRTRSRWAQLATEGKRILQFSCEGRYFANVCEGTVTRYPAWAALRLPD